MVKEHLGLGFLITILLSVKHQVCFPNFVYGECIYNASSNRRGFSLGFMETRLAVTHRKDNRMFPLYDNSLNLLPQIIADWLDDALLTFDAARQPPRRWRCSELATAGAGSENQADSIESCQVFHVFVVLPAAISCRAAVAFGSAWLICFAAASYNQGQSIQYVWSYCTGCGKLEGSSTAVSLSLKLTWCAFIYSFSRQNRRDACFYHLFLTSRAEAGKVKLKFSTEPNYTNLKSQRGGRALIFL